MIVYAIYTLLTLLTVSVVWEYAAFLTRGNGKHKADKHEVKKYVKTHFVITGSPIPLPGEWRNWHRAKASADHTMWLLDQAKRRSKK